MERYSLQMKGGVIMKKASLIIIILVVVALALPQTAQARGGHGGGSFIPGLCIGGVLGLLLSAPAVTHPLYAPSPPPGQCWKEVPERWEMHWDPLYNAYTRKLIPRHYAPCR